MVDQNIDDEQRAGVTRRTVLGASAGATAAIAFPIRLQAQNRPAAPALPPENGPTVEINCEVNGEAVRIKVDARASLLDLLRERLGKTGTKKGCDHGQCGACTVHLDGKPVVSCLTLAAKVDGRKIVTVEGLGSETELHPMQQAFIDHDALQCGYCTPGQLMSAIACVTQKQSTDPEAIREFMSGNICRCGAYMGILAAIQDAADVMEG